MSRPRSDEKRKALLEAATRTIVTQGLSAPTAGIAKEAGVANGSLFTYFETKSDLYNQLYLALKAEMAGAALKDLNPSIDISDEITPASRAAGHKTMADIAELLEGIRLSGPMRETPRSFVIAMLNSIAEATIVIMAQDAAHARERCREGFAALWRAIA